MKRIVYLVWLWGCLDSIWDSEKEAIKRRRKVARSEWSKDSDWPFEDHLENCSEVVKTSLNGQYKY